MRHVYPTAVVCRLWAGQSQEEARNTKSSVFFKSDTIYSYGHHFHIARHVRNSRGEQAVLFTTRSYSPTTRKHKSQVCSAIRYVSQSRMMFYVPEVNYSAHDHITSYFYRIEEAKKQLARCRQLWKRHWYRNNLLGLIDEANSYSHFFDLPVSFFDTSVNFADSTKTEEPKWPSSRRRFPESIREQAMKFDVIAAPSPPIEV